MTACNSKWKNEKLAVRLIVRVSGHFALLFCRGRLWNLERSHAKRVTTDNRQKSRVSSLSCRCRDKVGDCGQKKTVPQKIHGQTMLKMSDTTPWIYFLNPNHSHLPSPSYKTDIFIPEDAGFDTCRYYLLSKTTIYRTHDCVHALIM